MAALLGTLIVPPVLAQPAPAEAPAAGAPVEEEPLSIRLRRFADGLARGVGGLGGHPRYLTIAVLPFQEHGERTVDSDLGDLLTWSVRAAMARDYGLPVVPAAAVRVALQSVLDGRPDGQPIGPAEALKAAQELKARVVVVGNVSDAGDHFALSASVFATGDGDQAAPVEHRLLRVRVPEMLAAADEARVLRTKRGALWRSVLLPGWGQIYNRHDLKGGVVATTEVALLAGAVAFEVLGRRAESRYDQGLRETVPEREVAEDRYTTRNVLLAIAGGVWLYGAVDAWMGGADPDETPTLAAGPEPSFRLVPGLAFADAAGGSLVVSF